MAKHHYVSKFYYKNFVYSAENPFVYTMNKEGKISNRRKSASQIGYEADYNTPDQEREQGKLETKYNRVLMDFIKESDQEGHYPADEFIRFVSFIFGNNIFVRKKLGSACTLENILPGAAELGINIVMDNGHKGKFDWSQSFSDLVYKEFQNWQWELIRLDPRACPAHFITSDNPVSIFNPENVENPIDLRLKCDGSKHRLFRLSTSKDKNDIGVVVTFKSISFGQNVVLTFPITPRLGLIGFSYSETQNNFNDGSKNNLIEFINLMTFFYCNNNVCSYSKELLLKVKANVLGFLNYCDENNLVPSFEVGIQ